MNVAARFQKISILVIHIYKLHTYSLTLIHGQREREREKNLRGLGRNRFIACFFLFFFVLFLFFCSDLPRAHVCVCVCVCVCALVRKGGKQGDGRNGFFSCLSHIYISDLHDLFVNFY
jgi:hypothetical protein